MTATQGPAPDTAKATELTAFNCRLLSGRMQHRVDSCLERHGGDAQRACESSGIGISWQFAKEVARALNAAAKLLDPSTNDAMMDPRMPPPFDAQHRGVQFYAKNGRGEWFYVNHAHTWQTCPPPFPTGTPAWAYFRPNGSIIAVYLDHEHCGLSAAGPGRRRVRIVEERGE